MFIISGIGFLIWCLSLIFIQKLPENMAIDLSKGQRFELSPEKITVGLGWKPTSTPTGEPDLDASVFLLDERRKIPEDYFFVFYNNLKSPMDL